MHHLTLSLCVCLCVGTDLEGGHFSKILVVSADQVQATVLDGERFGLQRQMQDAEVRMMMHLWCHWGSVISQAIYHWGSVFGQALW